MRRQILIALVAMGASPAVAQDVPTWAEISALFAERCTVCHSGEAAPLGLRLDTLEKVLAGSENGPVLQAGDPAGSELVRRLKGESQPRMPLTGPPFLEDSQIAMVERWIAAGMPSDDVARRPEAERDRPAPGEPVMFAHVEPILLQHCAKCHMEGGLMGSPPEGLRLDSYAHALQGGERPTILPGNPGLSELVRRIEGKSLPRMPFDGPPWLSEDDVRLIRQWIAQGAPDAEGDPAPVPVGRDVRYRGVLTGRWEIDGAAVIVDGATRIDKEPRVGEPTEVRGVVQSDGRVRATRVRPR